MPAERQQQIRARFARAVEHFRAAGLLDQMAAVNRMDLDERHKLGIRYLSERVACPFLEHESCSIYPQRPISCREYLVSSPPAYCAPEAAAPVEVIPLPLRVWNAAVGVDRDAYRADHYPWIPLILALEGEGLPEPAAEFPGPALVSAFFHHLTGKEPLQAPPSESEGQKSRGRTP
jgi:hypothetical protein